MRFLTILLLTFTGAVRAADGAPPIDPQPFTATYAWSWHGMTVAESTLRLEREPDATWIYRSSSEPRGIARIYPLHPTLKSTMSVTGDVVRPLRFEADDGRGTESRHSDVSFDWLRSRVQGVYSGVRVDLELKGEEQDDLSAQIALLQALRNGKTPRPLAMIDKNTVRDYEIESLGDERVSTAIGTLDTVIYATHHPGSGRVTRFWCASSRGYVPVRIRQLNEGNVEWTMEIKALAGG